MAGAADDVVAAWAARGAGRWRAGGRPAVRTGYLRGSGRGDPRGDDAARAAPGPGARLGGAPRGAGRPRAAGPSGAGAVRDPSPPQGLPGLDSDLAARSDVRTRWNLRAE
eukprot:7958859-Alexandrium_andersonii.AAC.1